MHGFEVNFGRIENFNIQLKQLSEPPPKPVRSENADRIN
jgi:hypothetical protein